MVVAKCYALLEIRLIKIYHYIMKLPTHYLLIYLARKVLKLVLIEALSDNELAVDTGVAPRLCACART